MKKIGTGLFVVFINVTWWVAAATLWYMAMDEANNAFVVIYALAALFMTFAALIATVYILWTVGDSLDESRA